jgi:hypothetical protein
VYHRSSAVAAILGGARQAAQQRFARAGGTVSALPPLAPDLAAGLRRLKLADTPPVSTRAADHRQDPAVASEELQGKVIANPSATTRSWSTKSATAAKIHVRGKIYPDRVATGSWSPW